MPNVCCFQLPEGQNCSPSCSRGRKQRVLEGPGPRIQSRPRGSGYCKLIEYNISQTDFELILVETLSCSVLA